jgi:hypothetical protein
MIENAVRLALRDGVDPDVVAEFVASVDWSGSSVDYGPAADDLSRLEGWTTEFIEHDLSESEYVSRLRSLLPAEEPIAGTGRRPT